MHKKKLIIFVLAIVLIILGGFIFNQQAKSKNIKDNMKLANKYVQDGKYEEAELALLNVISVQPKNIEARIELAKAYTAEKKYDKAEQTLKDAAAIDINNPMPKEELAKLYILQGKELLSAGKLNEAKDMFDKAVEVDKKRVKTYSEIADYYETTAGKVSEAMVILTKGYEETMDSGLKSRLDGIKEKITGNTNGNLVNGGLVAQQGDWIYYLSLAENSYLSNINKIKTDGSSKIKLSSVKGEYSCLNVVEDTIYYISSDDIYRMDTSGSNNIKLIEGDSFKDMAIDMLKREAGNTNNMESYFQDFLLHIGSLNVVGDKLYFNVSISFRLNSNEPYTEPINMIVSYRRDGTEEKVLCKTGDKVATENGVQIVDPYDFIIIEDWIYYYSLAGIDYHGSSSFLCKVKKDGTENSFVLNNYDKTTSFFIGPITGDSYLVSNINDRLEAEIYKIGMDFKEKIKIDIFDVDSNSKFNVSENYLYYSDRYNIYKIKSDGSCKEKIYTTNDHWPILYINVVDEWIYFEKYSGVADGKCEILKMKADGTDLQGID